MNEGWYIAEQPREPEPAIGTREWMPGCPTCPKCGEMVWRGRNWWRHFGFKWHKVGKSRFQ